MKRIAVFGNAGGGKSTLARRLSELTGLPLCSVDSLKYRPGGGEVPESEYLQAHADLLYRDEWIIDGFGSTPTAWERFTAADTLIYVDLPLPIHYMWVTKRLIKGSFVKPEGWPEDSPMWRGSIASYRVIPLCHRHLTPKYRQLVADSASEKRVHHLRSPHQMRAFLHAVEQEYGGA
ncbi:MAG: adenylate kinase [Coriobacteriia bacterium]|nr:adenylate kinase [Coriobacteriia bacterium]